MQNQYSIRQNRFSFFCVTKKLITVDTLNFHRYAYTIIFYTRFN